jgi:PKD repeat protein
MWYGGNDNTSICQIGHATSPDGIQWTRQAPALAADDGSQAWEGRCIDNPRVVFDGTTYRMWYLGGPFSVSGWRGWSIGLATSTDKVHWTRYPGNPVLKLDQPDNPTGLLPSYVLFDELRGLFEMFLGFTHDGTSWTAAAIGYATSADGIEWCAYDGNPVFSQEGATWDFGFIGQPSVLFDGSEYSMWYLGGPGTTWNIGRATSPWTIPKASFTAAARPGSDSLTIDCDATKSVTPNAPITEHAWDFGDGTEPVTTGATLLASHTYKLPGHYVVKLTVTDNTGAKGAVTRGVDVSSASCDVAPWSVAQIGSPLFAGSACLDRSTGCLSLDAGGKLLAGTSDQLTFVHQPATGDTVLTARVEGASGADDHWQVGVMLRESLDADSRHVSMLVHKLGSVTPARFRSVARSATAGLSSPLQSQVASPPNAWVRVERQGDDFVTSWSEDGKSWTSVQTVALAACPDTILAGVVAIGTSSSSPFLALRATVCELSIRPPAPPGLGPFLRGDANGDGDVTGQVTDAVFLLAFNFTGGPAPPCLAACDANADGKTDISDAIYTLAFNFLGGPPPAAPFPTCGRSEAPGDEALGCATPLATCP